MKALGCPLTPALSLDGCSGKMAETLVGGEGALRWILLKRSAHEKARSGEGHLTGLTDVTDFSDVSLVGWLA